MKILVRREKGGIYNMGILFPFFSLIMLSNRAFVLDMKINL